MLCKLLSIVFKSGPVQDRGSGFWPDHPGQFLFFKKYQNGVVLVKETKINELQPGFWPGFAESIESYWIMIFFYFFLTRPGFNSGLARYQVSKFQNYAIGYENKIRVEWWNSFQYLYPKNEQARYIFVLS